MQICIAKGLGLVICLSSSLLFSKADWRKNYYQDLFINGETVHYGARECASRYESLRTVLDKYKRPITVLDIGASMGYFAFRIAHDYDAICVLLEGGSGLHLLNLCKANTDLTNIVYLKRFITVDELKILSRCEHFDVVLLFNVVHHVPRCYKFIDAVFELGDNIIVETPPAEDKHFTGGMGSLIRGIENYFMNKGPYTVIGQTPRHTDPSATAKMMWFERKKQTLSKAYWLHPDTRPGCWKVESDYEKKIFIKNRDNDQETREWIPGINLLTFKMLNGIYPEIDYIKDRLVEFKESLHPDGIIWNMILQGKNIELIDANDPIGRFNVEKVLQYNFTLMDFNPKELSDYVERVDHREICK